MTRWNFQSLWCQTAHVSEKSYKMSQW